MFGSLTLGFLTWDWNPILIDFGPLQIRWYGLMFAATIYTGFYVWQRQCLKNGETIAFAEQFLWWGVVAIVGGARLGHVFFYEPKTFLANPIEIIKFWKGGLASHGATVGLILALWLFGRKHGKTWFRLGDYLAPAIAIAAGGVRIGNFFNSEIVGRVACHRLANGTLDCEVPWAVEFTRYCQMEGLSPCLPRHPSQIYEFLMGVVTYVVVMAVERKGWRRAGSGLMAGVFLATYFSFRFIVDFFKEFQIEQLRTDGPLGGLEQAFGVHFRMGQWLSVLPILFGIFCIVRAMRQDKDAIPEPVPTPPVPAGQVLKGSAQPAKKRK